MLRLIIFDWDDVFTHGATEGYFASYHKALVESGVNLSPEEEHKRINSKWGSTVEEEISELLKEHPDKISETVKKYETIIMGDTFVDCLRLVEGSKDLIENLSKKYLLAVASGVNPKVLKEKIFPRFSIPNVFKEIITVYDLDDLGHAKPHPYMPQEIMRRLNVSPKETILVGDAKGDMLMAQSAGVTPVAVLTGQLNREQAESLGLKFIIENVTKLEDILEQIESSS